MTSIELRDEEPPDDAVVVVRGGEMNSAFVRRLAQDPTLARPHFDVLLPDLADGTLDRLELAFDQPIRNPAR